MSVPHRERCMRSQGRQRVNTPVWVGNAGAPILPAVEDTEAPTPSFTGGLSVGGGMLIVPATGTLTAFGDTTVTRSTDMTRRIKLIPLTTVISPTTVSRLRLRRRRSGVSRSEHAFRTP